MDPLDAAFAPKAARAAGPVTDPLDAAFAAKRPKADPLDAAFSAKSATATTGDPLDAAFAPPVAPSPETKIEIVNPPPTEFRGEDLTGPGRQQRAPQIDPTKPIETQILPQPSTRTQDPRFALAQADYSREQAQQSLLDLARAPEKFATGLRQEVLDPEMRQGGSSQSMRDLAVGSLETALAPARQVSGLAGLADAAPNIASGLYSKFVNTLAPPGWVRDPATGEMRRTTQQEDETAPVAPSAVEGAVGPLYGQIASVFGSPPDTLGPNAPTGLNAAAAYSRDLSDAALGAAQVAHLGASALSHFTGSAAKAAAVTASGSGAIANPTGQAAGYAKPPRFSVGSPATPIDVAAGIRGVVPVAGAPTATPAPPPSVMRREFMQGGVTTGSTPRPSEVVEAPLIGRSPSFPGGVVPPAFNDTAAKRLAEAVSRFASQPSKWSMTAWGMIGQGASELPGAGTATDKLRDWFGKPTGQKFTAGVAKALSEERAASDAANVVLLKLADDLPKLTDEDSRRLFLSRSVAGDARGENVSGVYSALGEKPANFTAPYVGRLQAEHKAAFDALAAHGQQLAEVGIIPEATRAMESGSYIHRYYAEAALNEAVNGAISSPEWMTRAPNKGLYEGRTQGLAEAASDGLKTDVRASILRSLDRSMQGVIRLRRMAQIAEMPNVAKPVQGLVRASDVAGRQASAIKEAVMAAPGALDNPHTLADAIRYTQAKIKGLRDEFKAGQEMFGGGGRFVTTPLTTEMVEKQRAIVSAARDLDAMLALRQDATFTQPTLTGRQLLATADAHAAAAAKTVADFKIAPAPDGWAHLHEALKEIGWAQDEAGAKATAASTRRFGNLADALINKRNLVDVVRMDAQPNEVGRLIREMTATWATMLTSDNPLSHRSNLIGNIVTADLTGYSVHRQPFFDTLARASFEGNDGVLKAARSLGLELSPEADPKALRLLRQELYGAKPDKTVAGRWATRVGKVRARLQETALAEAYRHEDDVKRFGHYLDGIVSRGLTPAEAAKQANLGVISSQWRSPAASGISTLHWFANWPIEASKVLGYAAARHPLRLAFWGALPYASMEAAEATGALRPGETQRRMEAEPPFRLGQVGQNLYTPTGRLTAAGTIAAGILAGGALAVAGRGKVGMGALKALGLGAAAGGLAAGGLATSANSPKTFTLPNLGVGGAGLAGATAGAVMGGAPWALGMGALGMLAQKVSHDTGRPLDLKAGQYMPVSNVTGLVTDPVNVPLLGLKDIAIDGIDPWTRQPLREGRLRALIGAAAPVARNVWDLLEAAVGRVRDPVSMQPLSWQQVAVQSGLGVDQLRTTIELEQAQHGEVHATLKDWKSYEGHHYTEPDIQHALNNAQGQIRRGGRMPGR